MMSTYNYLHILRDIMRHFEECDKEERDSDDNFTYSSNFHIAEIDAILKEYGIGKGIDEFLGSQYEFLL